jgi:hypothetical protein
VSAWRPIKSAPLTGKMVMVKAGRREFAAFWNAGAYENESGSCGGWAARDEDAAPPCWSDGVCWAVNEHGVRSAQPREWKPLPSERTAPGDATAKPSKTGNSGMNS